MNSYDIFDTLIARKCVSPQGIFSQIEARSGRNGFASVRIEAEQRLTGRDYGLQDIYIELAAMLGLTAEESSALQQLEIDIELANVIPIQANLDRVRDGDLLISDMYLDRTTIGALLRQAGLQRHVAIYQSTAGKGSGQVWKKLREHGVPLVHTGDHPIADVAQPVAYGFGSLPTTTAQLNTTERMLADQGCTGTAILARTLRLGLGGEEPIARGLRECLATTGAPLLILASIYLARRLRERPVDTLLFSSRDCHAWYRIFKAIAPTLGVSVPKHSYFFTSRLARTRGSESYRDYVRSLARGRTLIVDLCGTGLSLARMIAECNVDASPFFLLRITTTQIVEHARRHYAGDVTISCDAILASDETAASPSWETWEMLNYAEHGMVLDVRALDDVHFPLCAESEFSPRQSDWIRGMHAMIAATLKLLEDPLVVSQLLAADTHVADAELAKTIAALWQTGAQSPYPRMAFGDTHQADNLLISQRLGAPAAKP